MGKENFEEAMQKLEEIVRALEAGDLSLEESCNTKMIMS